MPHTFAGFLALSGLLMFLVGIIGGNIRFAGFEIPPIFGVQRFVLIALGALFLFISFDSYTSTNSSSSIINKTDAFQKR